jgi:hypothetical protein
MIRSAKVMSGPAPEPAEQIAGAKRRFRTGQDRARNAPNRSLWQAMPGAAVAPRPHRPGRPAWDHGISRATAHRYLDEIIAVLTGQGSAPATRRSAPLRYLGEHGFTLLSGS